MTSHDNFIKKKIHRVYLQAASHLDLDLDCHNFLNKSSLMVKNPASVIGHKYHKDVME